MKNSYYWGSKGQLYVTESPNKVHVIYREKSGSRASTQSSLISTLYDVCDYNFPIFNFEMESEANKLDNIKTGVGNIKDTAELRKMNEVIYVAPYYTLSDGKEYPLSNIFYVELRDSLDVNLLNMLAVDNKVRIIGRIPLIENAYILSCTKESRGNALEMANFFYESGNFLSSSPEFISAKTESINDPYFSNQWNLYNVGQIGNMGVDINLYDTHSLSTGSNTIVALIDKGMPINHLDIQPSYVHDALIFADTNIIYDNDDGGHGIACAGIIAAETNNGIGIVGIAPDCKLMSISSNLSAASLAYAICYAVHNGADVISNSWGSASDMPVVNSAIKYAIQHGRSGKGCVVVFSAGNNNNSYVNYPKAADPDIIVVGALSPCGERKSYTSCDGENWWGSNYGNDLDIMAPGVKIATTDRPGIYGYNSGDYAFSFNGTSSACPHVSGVAALILAVNPYLTQREVCDIIEKSATKLPSYLYTTKINRPNGTWNNETGYGLLNANAAVQMALSDDYSKSVVELENLIITTPRFFNGDVIKCKQVSSYPGGALILSADDMIEINSPFTFMAGSSFEFHIQQ